MVDMAGEVDLGVVTLDRDNVIGGHSGILAKSDYFVKTKGLGVDAARTIADKIARCETRTSGYTMSAPSVSLGYVILYVKDVSASVAFYEQAFGLTRRFFHEENGKGYGELETGAARLAFVSVEIANEHSKQEFVPASLDKPPPPFEIALVTADVPALYARAVKAGAIAVSAPAAKPWGQTVAYLRDNVRS